MRHRSGCANVTYDAWVSLQVKVISFDNLADDTLQGLANEGGLLGSQVVHCDVDERGVRADDVLDGVGRRYFIMHGGLRDSERNVNS